MGGKLLRAIGRAHHFAEGLTENLRLFEVPSIENRIVCQQWLSAVFV
ncbi:hypothetical protein NSMM_460007 [Nitrosomonas mobilis]|uniref:Uncharacterized protein n=1 Tax=Nitrosomonas mobilis TaxID=51642 RepID=A0A1G5SFD3_9PROT|nr:hypothetical protein NSMM_460007 [Nitrosomonas mobilis]